ncbi:hypothetical protein ACMV_19810 [Acidiphilium multivorum AIU301]|uniref:Transposase n=1 Tax=Acidiphilium multivorum (strain DSM 11245 / JCM 8867 / NBRC 100883 / AIU 301) TaxID=926570 RepID=F0IZW8_ACIMA|nr:hypothetical protein ACMV_19810 [Acidiphilium multivorum AIU301]
MAVVHCLFSRRIIGWSMKTERDAALVIDALRMAVWRRGNTSSSRSAMSPSWSLRPRLC